MQTSSSGLQYFGWTTDKGLSWKSALQEVRDDLDRAVETVSAQSGANERDLRHKLLLHLPRFPYQELRDPRVILNEAWRLAARMDSLHNGFQHWLSRPPAEGIDGSRLSLKPCPPAVAQAIHERFHYIGHFHDGIAHLGLYSLGMENVPVALASLSSFDILYLDPLFPSLEEKEKVLQISRIYAFQWAPRNIISFLLGRVSRWVKQNLPRISIFLTYVNPNIGFSGSSYRASNWDFFLQKEPVYSYLNGDYVPYRALHTLPLAVRHYLTHSHYQMEPLKLLKYDLTARSTRAGTGAS